MRHLSNKQTTNQHSPHYIAHHENHFAHHIPLPTSHTSHMSQSNPKPQKPAALSAAPQNSPQTANRATAALSSDGSAAFHHLRASTAVFPGMRLHDYHKPAINNEAIAVFCLRPRRCDGFDQQTVFCIVKRWAVG